MGREGGPRVRPHGEARPGPTPHGKSQSAAPMSRRMRFSVRGYPQSALFRDPNLPECAFPLRCRPGGAGRNPPARLRGTMESGSTGQMRSSNPPPGCGGDPQASVWGLTARKGAVWAEGLADGAPWARPGHHQAASCGLRRCRELGLREFVWVVASLPWRRGGCHRHAATQECTQIGETGLSALFWGIRVHCCAVGLGCGWPWDRNSVHKWEDRASRCRFGAFVYTVATREDRASDRGDSQECTQIGETGLSDPF